MIILTVVFPTQLFDLDNEVFESGSRLLLCHYHPLGRVSGIFTLNWALTNPAGKSQKGACFHVIHMAVVTGLLIIDCVHYEDFASSDQCAQ